MPVYKKKNKKEFNPVRYELENICTKEIWEKAISQAENCMSDIRSTEDYKNGKIDDIDACVKVAMDTGNHLAFALKFAEARTRKQVAAAAFKSHVDQYEKGHGQNSWKKWKILPTSKWRSLNFEYTEENLEDNALQWQQIKKWKDEDENAIPDRDALIQCAFKMRLDSAKTNQLLMNFGYKKLYESDVADFVASHYLDYYIEHDISSSDFDKMKIVFNLFQTFMRKQCLGEKNSGLRAEYKEETIDYVLLEKKVNQKVAARQCPVPDRWYRFDLAFTTSLVDNIKRTKINVNSAGINKILRSVQKKTGILTSELPLEIKVNKPKYTYIWKVREELKSDDDLNIRLNQNFSEYAKEYGADAGQQEAKILEQMKQALIQDGRIAESGSLDYKEEKTREGLVKCWTLIRLTEENKEWKNLYLDSDSDISITEFQLKVKGELETGEQLVLDTISENIVVVSLNHEKFWVISEKSGHVEYKKYDIDQLLIDNISEKLENREFRMSKDFLLLGVFREMEQTLIKNVYIGRGEFKFNIIAENETELIVQKGNLEEGGFRWVLELKNDEIILSKQAGVQVIVSNTSFRDNIGSDLRRFLKNDTEYDGKKCVDTSYWTRIVGNSHSTMKDQPLSDQWLDEHAYQFVYRPFSYFKKMVDFCNDYTAYRKYMEKDDFHQISASWAKLRHLLQDQEHGYLDSRGIGLSEMGELNKSIYEKQLKVIDALYNRRSDWIAAGEKNSKQKKGTFSTVRNLIEGRSVSETNFKTDEKGYVYQNKNITDKNAFEKWMVVTGHESEIGVYLVKTGFWENNFVGMPIKNQEYSIDRKDLLIIYALRYRDQYLDKEYAEYADRQKKADEKRVYNFMGLLIKIGESLLLKNRLDHGGNLKKSIYGRYWEVEDMCESKGYKIFPEDLMFFDIPKKKEKE